MKARNLASARRWIAPREHPQRRHRQAQPAAPGQATAHGSTKGLGGHRRNTRCGHVATSLQHHPVRSRASTRHNAPSQPLQGPCFAHGGKWSDGSGWRARVRGGPHKQWAWGVEERGRHVNPENKRYNRWQRHGGQPCQRAVGGTPVAVGHVHAQTGVTLGAACGSGLRGTVAFDPSHACDGAHLDPTVVACLVSRDSVRQHRQQATPQHRQHGKPSGETAVDTQDGHAHQFTSGLWR